MDRRTEIKLVHQAQRGDIEARNRLVLQWEPMLWKFCAQAFPNEPGRFFADAVEAFMKAIEGFDQSQGYRLITYAGQAVKRRLYRRKIMSGVVVVPELAAKHNTTKGKAMAAKHVRSLDKQSRNGASLMDQIKSEADDSRVDPNLVDDLRVAMCRLTERERYVLQARIGHNIELGDVGKELGISRERVRQIQVEATNKLRELMIN